MMAQSDSWQAAKFNNQVHFVKVTQRYLLSQLLYSQFHNRGKWGKVVTQGKVIIGPPGFNMQMTSFDKEQVIAKIVNYK